MLSCHNEKPVVGDATKHRVALLPCGALVVPIQAVSLGPECLLVHYFAAPATIALDAVHVEVDLAFSETALVVAENVPLAAGAHAANRWRAGGVGGGGGGMRHIAESSGSWGWRITVDDKSIRSSRGRGRGRQRCGLRRWLSNRRCSGSGRCKLGEESLALAFEELAFGPAQAQGLE